MEGSSRLGRRAKRAIADSPSGELAIADLTLLEIAMLGKKKVVSLRPNVGDVLSAIAEKFIVLPISPPIAAAAVSLKLRDRDPFDLVITATARVHGLTLITRDRRITQSKSVSTLW